MNKLHDFDWEYQPLRGPKPYRAYESKQWLNAIPGNPLREFLDKFYPESLGRIMIESVMVYDPSTDYDYVVKPFLCDDTIRASHWDLIDNLPESRLFTVASMVKPGVMIKCLGTGMIGIVMESNEREIIMSNGTKIKDQPVVIMCRDKVQLIENFVRGA
jgi:hypothetical protein